MIEVRLERIRVFSTTSFADKPTPCGECGLAHISLFFVSIDVAGETLILAPAICLMCLQALGVNITQAARDRNRQPL